MGESSTSESVSIYFVEPGFLEVFAFLLKIGESDGKSSDGSLFPPKKGGVVSFGFLQSVDFN